MSHDLISRGFFIYEITTMWSLRDKICIQDNTLRQAQGRQDWNMIILFAEYAPNY